MSAEPAPELKSLDEDVPAVNAESPSAPRAPWESLALTYAFAFGAGRSLSTVLDHLRGYSNMLQSAVELAGAGSTSSAWDALLELYQGLYGPACLLLGWLAWRKRISCLTMARWLCVLLIASHFERLEVLVTSLWRGSAHYSLRDLKSYAFSMATSLLAPCITLWILGRLRDRFAPPARCIVGVTLILKGLGETQWMLLHVSLLYGGWMLAANLRDFTTILWTLEGPALWFIGIGLFRWRSVRRLAGLVMLLGTASRMVICGIQIANMSSLLNDPGWIGLASGMCGDYLPPAILAWRLRSILSREDVWAFGEPRCRVCEYNLTGNLSGICPECGTPAGLDHNVRQSQTATADPFPEGERCE